MCIIEQKMLIYYGKIIRKMTLAQEYSENIAKYYVGYLEIFSILLKKNCHNITLPWNYSEYPSTITFPSWLFFFKV